MPIFFEVIFPVVVLIAIGYGAARAGRFPDAAVRALSDATFLIFMPALLFGALARVDFDTLSPGAALAYYGAGLPLFAVVLGVQRWRGVPMDRAVIQALCGVFSNTAMLGIPLGPHEDVRGGLLLLYGAPRDFSTEDVQLARTFADQASLAMANAELRDQAEQTAVETERNRLARDLHDAVTQTLFSASLLAEALPTIWESDQEDGRELLAEMRRLIRGALAEMRTLLLELRPAALVEANLGDLLRQLADAIAGRKNVQVHVDCPYAPPTEVHVALYRIAQEALNNAVKHAHAKQLSVDLRSTVVHACDGDSVQNRVELVVVDDGRGFDPAKVSPDHLGLAIMRERAQAVGAGFHLQTRRNQGTRVTVTWTG